jgi:hypothetical protein
VLFNSKQVEDSHHRVLAVRCGVDPVLHALAPLGLAASRGTALVVDLDEEAPSYPGSTSLAKLVASQPRLADLRPRREGVAVLPNGSVDPSETAEVLEALVAGWPAVVLRLGPSLELPVAFSEVPVVPVAPLLPGFLYPSVRGPAVFQMVSPGPPPRVRGVLLPPLGRFHVHRMLSGMGFPPRRWVRAWQPVWSVVWR